MSEKKSAKAKEPSPGFEKALERLELLVAEMESGELDLEKMIRHFEEGQALIKLCSAKLNEVERKIEVLIRKEDGSTEAVSFETEADNGAPEPELEPDEGDGELF
jgi:exodeoxyribonuclease VII small subunit